MKPYYAGESVTDPHADDSVVAAFCDYAEQWLLANPLVEPTPLDQVPVGLRRQ